MMRMSHDQKKYLVRLRNGSPTTFVQYHQKRADNHLASFPKYVLEKFDIHANTNQMKAIPSPSIHKVDLEPQSVHITSLVEKF